MFEPIARFFQEGGFFMYPIAAVLVLGIAIAIERYWYLSVAKSVSYTHLTLPTNREV